MSGLRLLIGLAVTLMWVGMYVAALVDRSLEDLAGSITPVMLVVAGAAFGGEAVSLLKKGKS